MLRNLPRSAKLVKIGLVSALGTTEQKIKMNNGGTYGAAARGGFSAGAAKPGSRVKAGSIKRHSEGQHIVTKMSSD